MNARTKIPSRWPTPRNDKPYSAHDLKRMREMARRGMSARQAAFALKRTRGAVAFKAMVEGVSFCAVKQPKGVQRRPAVRRKIARARRARLAA